MRAYVGGTFDLFHIGHVELFRKLKELGLETVASVNRDEFVERYKGQPPVVPLLFRVGMLQSCKYVDLTVINEFDENARPTIERVKPRYIVHGDDWVGDSLKKQLGVDDAFLVENGIDMLYLPYTKGISSTEIRESLKKHETRNSNRKSSGK